jgi:hypothetical protein
VRRGRVIAPSDMSETETRGLMTWSVSEGDADAAMSALAASMIGEDESVTMIERLCSAEYLPGEAGERRIRCCKVHPCGMVEGRPYRAATFGRPDGLAGGELRFWGATAHRGGPI